MVQHALTTYENWQEKLDVGFHSTALITANDSASEKRKAYGLPLTPEQKEVLSRLFVRCTKPTTRKKHDLAQEFGVTRDKTDVSYALLPARSWTLLKLIAKNWFQNRRTTSRQTAKRKPRGAHANFTSSSKSHTISSHTCQDINRRNVASYATKPDSTGRYSSIPGPDGLRETAYVPSRTENREFPNGSGIPNAVHRGSKRDVGQPKLTTDTVTNQAPAVFGHNMSQISEVPSSTVFDIEEISPDHIPRPQVSIEGVSSVARPTPSHARPMRLTYRDNPLYSTTSEISVLTETARAGEIRCKAKLPTIEPLVKCRSVEEQGLDFFTTFIPP